MTKYAMYRAVLTMLVVLTILAIMCLFWTQPGEAAFYLCIFTLIIDVPVIAFIIIKLILAYKNNIMLDAQVFNLPEKGKKKYFPKEEKNEKAL